MVVETRRYTSQIMVEFPPEEEILGKYHFETGYLPLWAIFVLFNPRKTLEGIDDLAQNIKAHRQLNPLIVARLKRKDWETFSNFMNQFEQTKIDISKVPSVVEDGEEYFYVLLAGGRRFQACLKAKKEYVFATACIDISPLVALKLQASENTHMPVPPHEEARFYADLFNFSRQENPSYTKKEFASDVGRSEDKVRNALRFCDLPLEIQQCVEQFYAEKEESKKEKRGKLKQTRFREEPKGLSFTKAIDVARIHEELDATKEELLHWAKLGQVGRYSSDDFHKMVSKYIMDTKYGQTTLDLFTENQKEVMRRTFFRRIVAKEMLYAIWERIAYMKKVRKLRKDGLLGKADSPFSMGSPVRVYQAFVAEVEDMLPEMWEQLPEKEREKTRLVLVAGSVMLQFLVEVVPEENGDDGLALSNELRQLVYQSNGGQATKSTVVIH